MSDLRPDEQTEASPGVGTGSDAGSGRAFRDRSELETAGHSGDFEGREMSACPHCGHQLSMFREARSSPGGASSRQPPTPTHPQETDTQAA